MKIELAVVMPIYNEEASIEKVIHEWVPALEKATNNWVLIAIDDGSRDQTLAILNALKNEYSNNLIVHSHSNRGHGQSCVRGYELAIENSAQWIFQIDSDGQCDPKYFESLWKHRSENQAVFGYRVSRDDGQIRWWISRIVSIVVFIGTGIWVKDPNVPYRLIPTTMLKKILPNVPRDFHLTNILVAALAQKIAPIIWINIHFLDRHGGSPSVKSWSFAKQGIKLLKQLWKAQLPR